jgi:hypothetical protein
VIYWKKKIPSFFKDKRRPVARRFHPGRMTNYMSCNMAQGVRLKAWSIEHGAWSIEFFKTWTL